MKKYLIILLAMCAFSLRAQNESVNFIPNWQKGEKKSILMVRHEIEKKDGELESDTSIYLDGEITVVDENKQSYTVVVIYENVTAQAILKLHQAFEKELTKFRNLELKYKIDKKTGETELVNWKDVRDYMLASTEFIMKLFEEGMPELSDAAQLILAPVKRSFRSRESIEEYVQLEAGYLLYLYDKQLTAEDTTRITQSTANPFSPKDTLVQLTKVYLDGHDAEAGTRTIRMDEYLDLSTFKEMMKSVMIGMVEAFGATDSVRNELQQAFDQMEFDMSGTTTIIYNYNTGWPESIVTERRVTVNDLRNHSEKIVQIRTTLK